LASFVPSATLATEVMAKDIRTAADQSDELVIGDQRNGWVPGGAGEPSGP
jgi:hypothetical protein